MAGSHLGHLIINFFEAQNHYGTWTLNVWTVCPTCSAPSKNDFPVNGGDKKARFWFLTCSQCGGMFDVPVLSEALNERMAAGCVDGAGVSVPDSQGGG